MSAPPNHVAEMENSMLKMFVATLCTQREVPGDFCDVTLRRLNALSDRGPT